MNLLKQLVNMKIILVIHICEATRKYYEQLKQESEQN